jgi:[ribosomal protein S5]-alanine N-acetyltransferase
LIELLAIPRGTLESTGLKGLGVTAKQAHRAALQFYNKAGHQPPWTSYFVMMDGEAVGICSFKGAPKGARVEISYCTFPPNEGKHFATIACKLLVDIARENDPKLTITARTQREHNASCRVLEKNGFELEGSVHDPDDGAVWEWAKRP